jgi:hypothetical protein
MGDDPLTDEELEVSSEKWLVKHMDEQHIKKIFEAVWKRRKT